MPRLPFQVKINSAIQLKFTIRQVSLVLATCLFFQVSETNAQELSAISPDIGLIPYSVRGSYLSVTRMGAQNNNMDRSVPDGIYIRNVSRRGWYENMIRVELLDGNKLVQPEITCSAGKLSLRTTSGNIEFVFDSLNTLRIRGTGLSLRLRPTHYSYAVPYGKERLRLLCGRGNDYFYMASALKGGLVYDRQVPSSGKNTCLNCSDHFSFSFLPDDGGHFEAALEEFQSEWRPRTYLTPFDRLVEKQKTDWDTFASSLPEINIRYAAASRLAAYQNWSAIVAPRGVLKREAMFMSKNWMNTYYSWDHCFNAIALFKTGSKEDAWSQFIGIFDHQDKLGALPDCVDDQKESWGILKTPVHGWALRRMSPDLSALSTDRLAEAYRVLGKLSNFWFEYRDPDHNGLPQYNHSFESFDDTPPFANGLPVEGPELASFLAVQMDMLSQMAGRLGKPSEAKAWQNRSDALVKTLISQLWKYGRFISRNAATGAYNKDGDSFISYVPLILGKKLPDSIRKVLISRLFRKNGLLCKYGFSTEAFDSPYFDPSTYTSGSVWSPVNEILIDGLEACGEHQLAMKAAGLYCDALVNAGFPERLDAPTGARRSDPAYTWTSSTFLTLCATYFKK